MMWTRRLLVMTGTTTRHHTTQCDFLTQFCPETHEFLEIDKNFLSTVEMYQSYVELIDTE